MAANTPSAASAARSRSRLRTTVRDMVLTMALIVVPILAVIWLMPSSTPKSPVSAVSTSDYQAMLTAARGQLPFEPLSPTGLPGSWELTSDEYQPVGATAADWHLGYLTGSGKYAEFEQTTESVAQYLGAQSSDATRSGSVTVAGVQWQRYAGTTPGALKTLLFFQSGKSLEVVAGSASLADLETLAASLRG